MWLTERLPFFKANSQFLYALLLIVLVPTILAFNTLFIVRAIDRDINSELRSKASLVGNILAPSIESSLKDPSGLEKRLSEILKNTQGEIIGASVLIPNVEGDKFNVYVTTDKETTKKDSGLIINQIAWSGGKSYASQVYGLNREKLWSVVSPVKDLEGRKVALINVKVSTALVEKTIGRTIKDSLMIMVGTIFLVLLLLLNHIRFFETSVLFSRLKEVNKLKDVFISVASHELLSPMTAIKGYLELLKSSALPATNEVRDNIRYLSDNFDRLQELVMDLLDVGRIENNKVLINPKPLNLEETLKEVLTEFAFMARQRNLSLNYKLTLGLPEVLADERRLRQVLTNIVSNALKYTKVGGLTIAHEFDKKTVTTHFRDTGMGISDSERANLFQKFYRVRTPETEDIPGTGLGLWLVKQFVERMRGKVYLESIEHSGTQVTLVLGVAKRL